MIVKVVTALPDENGGGDLSLVAFAAVGDGRGAPSCRRHGAMNKVSPEGIWRCITTAGPKGNPCRAGCIEVLS